MGDGWFGRCGEFKFNVPVGRQLHHSVVRGRGFGFSAGLSGDRYREGHHGCRGSRDVRGVVTRIENERTVVLAGVGSSSLAISCCLRASRAVLACITRRLGGARPDGRRLVPDPDC